MLGMKKSKRVKDSGQAGLGSPRAQTAGHASLQPPGLVSTQSVSWVELLRLEPT